MSIYTYKREYTNNFAKDVSLNYKTLNDIFYTFQYNLITKLFNNICSKIKVKLVSWDIHLVGESPEVININVALM